MSSLESPLAIGVIVVVRPSLGAKVAEFGQEVEHVLAEDDRHLLDHRHPVRAMAGDAEGDLVGDLGWRRVDGGLRFRRQEPQGKERDEARAENMVRNGIGVSRGSRRS